jgi:hypothetical protein
MSDLLKWYNNYTKISGKTGALTWKYNNWYLLIICVSILNRTKTLYVKKQKIHNIL